MPIIVVQTDEEYQIAKFALFCKYNYNRKRQLQAVAELGFSRRGYIFKKFP